MVGGHLRSSSSLSSHVTVLLPILAVVSGGRIYNAVCSVSANRYSNPCANKGPLLYSASCLLLVLAPGTPPPPPRDVRPVQVVCGDEWVWSRAKPIGALAPAQVPSVEHTGQLCLHTSQVPRKCGSSRPMWGKSGDSRLPRHKECGDWGRKGAALTGRSDRMPIRGSQNIRSGPEPTCRSDALYRSTPITRRYLYRSATRGLGPVQVSRAIVSFPRCMGRRTHTGQSR